MNNNKQTSKDYEICKIVESYSNLNIMNAVKNARDTGALDGKKIVEIVNEVRKLDSYNSRENNMFGTESRMIALYGRVSTEHDAQLYAFENQMQYYDNQVALHPEWKVYKTYSDEGVTGTSIKKRKGFLQMIEDAKSGKFDLIVTREISRFARNTVDTLTMLRELKKSGVEVYFVTEGLWSFDPACEFVLTLLASIAQNESEKTSQRVKAGQKISFENGVLYGNGNILGYDRVGKKLIKNPEQAKTVRMIYDLYLEGNGMTKIKFALEKAGRLTATGKTNWDAGNISRILNNPFYCGIIVYRKQFVADYLEQKKINNFGEVEKIVVQGTHETIVTEEEFIKVQEILETKSSSRNNRGRRGIRISNDIWGRKLRCACGATLQRKTWHKNKETGVRQYAYQCSCQVRTKTVRTRKNQNLSIEGICDIPMVPEWKLGTMADVIFKNLFANQEEVLDLANEMLDKYLQNNDYTDILNKIEKIEAKISEQNRRYDNLIDMRLSGEIDKERFEKKKTEVLDEIERLEKVKGSYQIDEEMTEAERKEKLNELKYILQEDFNFETHSLPDEVIDVVVDRVEVHKDSFVFKLNLAADNVTMKADGRKNHCKVSLVESNTPLFKESSSGSDQK